MPDLKFCFIVYSKCCMVCMICIKMATVETQTPVVAKGDNVEAGVLRGTVLNIKETGQPARAPGNIYGTCNFHIRNSHDYVGGHPLTTYTYFYYMEYIYILVFIASLFSPLVFYLAITCFVLNILVLSFYIQHMYVNIKTMRYVLKQPGVPNHLMTRANTFLEISLEEFAVAYAATKEAGFGIVSREKGTVNIQVFKYATKGKMKTCVCVSTLSFLTAITLILYCGACAIGTGIRTF